MHGGDLAPGPAGAGHHPPGLPLLPGKRRQPAPQRGVRLRHRGGGPGAGDLGGGPLPVPAAPGHLQRAVRAHLHHGGAFVPGDVRPVPPGRGDEGGKRSHHLKEAGGDLSKLEGKEYFAEFFDPTDKLGADVPNPKSHVAYGFATHVVILDDDGRVKEVYAAHDSGKVVNPISIQGQIEGGVLMGLGYALTEDFPLKNGVPQAKYGTLGLMRSTQIPDIHAIYVEKEELLPFAYGAKGIGEIATIPTAPAAQGAYYAMDHVLRTKLPMEDTYYSKKQKAVK